MHRTLKEETALPPRSSLDAQQTAFDSFREEFNKVRPHEALGFLTPAKVYKSSKRTFPKKILEVAYPTHIVTDKVHESGFAQYGPHRVFFGNPFIGEVVGFEEISDRHCRLYFADAILGILDLYTSKVLKYQRLLYRID
ncbi:integrase core domain protein [Leptospira vanthielii serovar Holland str. Waz Holland = ATCC 700522]|nr:integrase core domain-containing protein [Leptospira vanthielii]EMY71881.1 integrase core domain protein [Leptospira vanthielii serovar Holland str. Waz Holland = ATCC 700522]